MYIKLIVRNCIPGQLKYTFFIETGDFSLSGRFNIVFLPCIILTFLFALFYVSCELSILPFLSAVMIRGWTSNLSTLFIIDSLSFLESQDLVVDNEFPKYSDNCHNILPIWKKRLAAMMNCLQRFVVQLTRFQISVLAYVFRPARALAHTLACRSERFAYAQWKKKCDGIC